MSVSDAPANSSPAELLRALKPREADWTVKKDVEDGLTIGGRPAARVTFSGLLNPDGQESRQCISEVVAVRCGQSVIYFAGTSVTAEAEAQHMIRAAVESAEFY